MTPNSPPPAYGFTKEPAESFAKGLSAEERAVFDSTPAAEQLLQALRELQDADAQHKESSISRRAGEAIVPFVVGLEQYGKALDIFANSNDLLCPIWGTIRVLMHVAKEFGEYFDKLSAMMEEVGQILSRLPRCLRLYPDNKALQDAVVGIYHTIFDFCTKAHHVFRLGKSRSHGIKSMKNAVGFAAALRVVWKPFSVQFGGIKDRIAKGVSTIEAEADVAEKELAGEERKKNVERWAGAAQSQQMLADFIDEQSMAKASEWLSPVNVATNHKAAANLRHADTGAWFLRGDAFTRWLEEDNSFLWLHAIPGAGKTVLASSIINHLRSNWQAKNNGLAYFYCDYKDLQKQEPSKVLGTILATLSKQNKGVFEEIQKFFVQQYRETSTFTAEFDELLNNFSIFIGDHFESLAIVVDALDEAGHGNWDCLTHALRTLHETCPRLKILVTSRNELPIARAFEDMPTTSIEQSDVASDIRDFITAELASKVAQRKLKLRDPGLELVIRERLVEGAKGMFQWAKCQIETLCKLRNDKAIRAALSNLPRTLQDTYVRILQRVEDDHPEDVEIVSKILCWLVRGIRHLTLDELAEAIAINPEAEDSFMDFDSVDNDPEDILELLGGLVTVSADRVISLAHYSVKEFLVSPDMKKTKPLFFVAQEEVEAQLASVCLTYLCYDDFKRPELPDLEELQARLDEYKLFRYAAQAWAIHAQQSEKDGKQEELVVGLTMRLFQAKDESQGNFESWLECYRHFKFSRQLLKRQVNPLFCASYFGLTEATSQLLEEESDDDVDLSEPLRAAAAGGHTAVIKLFLDRFANDEEKETIPEENVEDGDEKVEAGEGGGGEAGEGKEEEGWETEEEVGENEEEQEDDDSNEEEEEEEAYNRATDPRLSQALYIAAAKGHAQVAELLLDYGVDINLRGGRDGTALQAAALEGRSETVRMLLRRGANHWESCKRFGTPLAAAAEKAHERTATVLLEHGANPNGRGGWYSLPLVSAIVGKNINIVRLLIEGGADLNGVGGRHTGPLPAAAAMGMNDLIRELVDCGAKVNDEDDKTSDAIYSAALAGHADTVDLLLELGADVDAKGGRHRNALGAASAEGHLAIVQKLLEAGADVGFFDEHWGNALQVAAQHGHVDIVKALAEAGVDSNADAGDKGTALSRAAGSGHSDVLAVLFALSRATQTPAGWQNDEPIEHGFSEEELTTALVAAASGGHESAIRLLVDEGADVNAVDWQASNQTPAYCCPLEAAAYAGSLSTVKMLLGLGAEANDDDEGYFGTALVAAVNSPKRSTELIIALIDAGAEVDKIAPEACQLCGYPLVHAVKLADVECTKLLLERGADVNIHSGTCFSAIQMAATLDDDEMLELLIDKGADVNTTIEPEDLRGSIEDEDGLQGGPITALQSAAWEGHDDRVRRLVGLGAELSVSVEDAVFSSALQVAAYRGHTSTVSALIELGSDVAEIGGYFGSALQAAACAGHRDTVEVLLDAGAQAEECDIGYFHSALVAACYDDSNTDLVRLLVERGANVNTKQNGGIPYALHAAAIHTAYTNRDVLKLLLELGADVNAQGGMFGTALQAVAAIGDAETTTMLLEHGADPNLTGGWYNTPLQAAYRCGYYIVIGTLYRHGADNSIRRADKAGSIMGQALGGTKCHDGAYHGACQTLIHQLLFRHNFDVNMEYGYYGNALQQAVMEQREEDVFNFVLSAGADINKVGGKMGTALTGAAFEGDMDEINELLARGADVNLGNYRYPNAAFGAVRGESREALKRLLEAGVDVTASGELGTALQGAAWSGRLDHVRMLIRHGAAINPTPGGLRGTPLQAAAARNHTTVMRYLIHRGADVRAKGGRLGGVLHTAVLTCSTETVELLLKKGANANDAGGIYGAPLQAACSKGSVDMVLLLLRYGADINRQGGKYGTALQAACVSGNWELVQILVERGADVGLTGGLYRQPLHAAAIMGHEDIVRYLLDKANASWVLVDRKALTHMKTYRLDDADDLLRTCQNEPEEEEEEEEEGASEGGEETEEEDTRLPLNVESIPGACERYKRPSKWDIVRSISLHLLKQAVLKTDVESGLLATRTDNERGSEGSNGLPPGKSGVFKSRSLPVRKVGEGELITARTWDSDALDWVQV